jgi:hypothetical protein
MRPLQRRAAGQRPLLPALREPSRAARRDHDGRRQRDGIAIGHGAAASVQQGLSGSEVASLFAAVYRRVDELPEAVDKDAVAETVHAVEQEAAKGEDADPDKVEGWLRRLAGLAPDVLEVTLATIANPVAGVTLAVRKAAERVRAEYGSG